MEPSLIVIGSMMFTTIGAVWTLALWITRQFSLIKTLIYEQFEKSLIRLESHEKHDNSRFAEVNTHLWELRLETANNKQRKSYSFDQKTEDRETRTP